MRDTLVSILQGSRSPELALAALEGLEDVLPREVSWNISSFAVRTMQPVRGRVVEDILRSAL